MATAWIAARKWAPEYVFASLVAGFGLLFAFAMPPCQTPDEPSHMLRSYHVSEGNMFPHMVGIWGGGEVPITILMVPAPFSNLPLQPENQTRLGRFLPLMDRELYPEARRPVPFPGSTYYTFVPYLPQAVGMAAARAVGGGPLTLFYAGRLANLAFAVLLVFWAIRITPIFKIVFGMVSLIPMTVHQFASLSPDASTIGVAFLLSALFLRLITEPDFRASRGFVAALFAVALWLTLCKFPYALLTLLYLAVPAERVGGWRRYLTTGAALFLVVFGLALAETQLKKFTPDGLPRPDDTASITGQMHFIRHHPFAYARVLVATMAEHGKIWIDQLGVLGWLDTHLNPLAMHLFFASLVIVSLGDRLGDYFPPLRLRLIALGASLICMVVILTSCYVCGCPVKSKLIIGPQGRYFLPFLPLMLLSLSNGLLRVQASPRVLLTGAASAGSAILVVALFFVIRRYYLPFDDQLWLSPLALTTAALLLAAVALVSYLWQPSEEGPVEVLATRLTVEETESHPRSRSAALSSR